MKTRQEAPLSRRAQHVRHA